MKTKATIELKKMSLAKLVTEFEDKIITSLEQKIANAEKSELTPAQEQRLKIVKGEFDLQKQLIHEVRDLVLYHGAMVACVSAYIKEVEDNILEDGKLVLPIMEMQAEMFNEAWLSLKLVDNLYSDETNFSKVSELIKKFDVEPGTIEKTV